MLTQTITVNLTQSKLSAIIMRSEEKGREIRFEVIDEAGEAVDLTEYAVKFIMLKPDENVVMTDAVGGVVTQSEQMTAVKGVGYYCIRLIDDDTVVYSGQGKVLIDDHVVDDETLQSISEVDGIIFPDDFLTIDSPVAMIDDNTTSAESTWSSDKISDELAGLSVEVSKTVTGNPVEFSDGAESPISSGILSLQGYQDGSGIATAENVRTVHYYSGNTVRVEDVDESGIDYATTYPVNMYAGYVNLFSKAYTCNKLVLVLNTADMDNTDAAPGWNNCGISDIVGEGHYIIQNIAICNICNKYNIDTMLGNDRITLENTGKTQTQLIAMALDVQIVVELSAPQFGNITASPYPIKTLKGYNKITADAGSLTVQYITEDYSPITKVIPDPVENDGEIHYTETEKPIGTWIDGSTVYEKTIKLGSFHVSAWGSYIIEASTDIDTLVGCYGCIIENGKKYAIPEYGVRITVDTSNNLVFTGTANWNIDSGNLTIRYTK